jgi:hypothetical protein
MMSQPPRSEHIERVFLTTGKMKTGTGDLYRHKRNMRSDASKLSRVRTKSNFLSVKPTSRPSPERRFEIAYKKVLSLRTSHLKRRLTPTERRQLKQAVAHQCGYQEESFLFCVSPPPPTHTPKPVAPPLPQSHTCERQAAIEMLHMELARQRQMIFDLEDRLTRSNVLAGCSFSVPTGNLGSPICYTEDTTKADEFDVPTVTVDFKDPDYIYVVPTQLVQAAFNKLHPPVEHQVATRTEVDTHFVRLHHLIEDWEVNGYLISNAGTGRPHHLWPTDITKYLYGKSDNTTIGLPHGASVSFYPNRTQIWYFSPEHTRSVTTTTYHMESTITEFKPREHQKYISDLAHRMIRKTYLTFATTSPSVCSTCIVRRRDYIFEHHPLISNSLTDEDLSLTTHWRTLMQHLGATCDQ